MTDHHPETAAITGGRRFSGDSLAPVLFPSTTYELESVADHRRAASSVRPPRFYARFGSPSVRELEDAVAELEGAEAALATASGMAAVSAVVLGLCSSGDHVVATRQLFSVTAALFEMHCPRFGIDVTLVDGTDPEAIAAACASRPTQLLFVETPANPTLSLVDLDAVGAIKGPIKVVDSTFATPAVQRPLDHEGIDLVVHSATKGIAGHNDALLGVVAGDGDVVDAVWAWHTVMGAQASPFDAWNGLRGVRTLFARVRRQSETALRLARFLEAHPAVVRVSYPFLESHPQHELARRQMASGGALVAFELVSRAAAEAFCDSLQLARLAMSLGGPETLVSHPATNVPRMTPAEREAAGISDGLVRLSAGLEHPEDLEADLAQALDKAQAATG